MFEDFTTGMLLQSSSILADGPELATGRFVTYTQSDPRHSELGLLWASIGISQSAKPLGDMLDRWGVYVGMISAWMSLPLIISSVQAIAGGHLLGGSVLLIDAVLAALASLGILRRRKFGVVSLGLAVLDVRTGRTT
jgi:hypothetical protein